MRTPTIDTVVRSTLAVAAKRDPSDLTSATDLAALAIDSLSLTTLIAQLEATFAIQLSPDQKMAIYDADDIGTIVSVAQEACDDDAFGGSIASARDTAHR